MDKIVGVPRLSRKRTEEKMTDLQTMVHGIGLRVVMYRESLAQVRGSLFTSRKLTEGLRNRLELQISTLNVVLSSCIGMTADVIAEFLRVIYDTPALKAELQKTVDSYLGSVEVPTIITPGDRRWNN